MCPTACVRLSFMCVLLRLRGWLSPRVFARTTWPMDRDTCSSMASSWMHREQRLEHRLGGPGVQGIDPVDELLIGTGQSPGLAKVLDPGSHREGLDLHG